MRCSISTLETPSGVLRVAAFTVEPRRLGSFPDDYRLCRHVLVDERAQNVVVAGEQVINIGWWVIDKWRLQKIASKTVYVQRTPPAADLTYTGVRMRNTRCQTTDYLTMVGQQRWIYYNTLNVLV